MKNEIQLMFIFSSRNMLEVELNTVIEQEDEEMVKFIEKSNHLTIFD